MDALKAKPPQVHIVEEMAKVLSENTEHKYIYNSVEPDVYRSFGFPGADDLGNMFQYKRDFNEEFTALRDTQRVKKLNPVIQNFEQWVKQHASEL